MVVDANVLDLGSAWKTWYHAVFFRIVHHHHETVIRLVSEVILMLRVHFKHDFQIVCQLSNWQVLFDLESRQVAGDRKSFSVALIT